MPRTPWLTGESHRIKRASTPQKPRIKPELPSNNSDDEKKTPRRIPTTPKPERPDFFRSSQSPPTSPIHRCPSEEYLREGLENDDIYIMVEDEFYSVAQTFTQHLHYAEYVKRQKEVKKLSEATIRDLVRPTDGTPILEETRKKKEAEDLSARQKNGLDRLPNEETGENVEGKVKQDELEDAEEDAEWEGTFLYDLMTSPRKARSLVGAKGIRSSTRAAAGFAKQTGYGSSQVDASSPVRSRPREPAQRDLEETASEDGDLDLPTNVQDSQTPTKGGNDTNGKAFIARGSPARTPSAIDSETKDIPSMNARYRSPTGFKPRKKKLFNLDDFDEIPEFNKSGVSIQEQRNLPLPRGSERRDSGDNPKSKKARLNEVPTFLL